MRFSRLLLPAALFLAVPLAYAAPQQRETTTVEVVQVPVYVTTAGASVRGLTRDDFTLRVNGRPQKIDYFDVVDFASLSPDQARDPRQRRLYVLTFDVVNSSPNSALRAKRAAEKYLAGAQPSDYFAVALINRYNGIELVVPFTRDQALLRLAVAGFSAGSSTDPLRLTVTPADRAVLINTDSAEIAELRRIGSGVAVELAVEAARSRAEDQLDALGQLAERMAPLEGYKHIVLLSNGFDSSVFFGGSRPATSNLRIGSLAELTALRRQQQTLPGFDARLPSSQRRMQRRFAAAGVFLDAIDLNGVRPFDMPSNDSLHFVVADTGGQVVEHRNDLSAAMQRLTDSQQIVYVLGFHAPDSGRKQNEIAVNVAGAPHGSTVAYREAYTSLAGKPSTHDGLRLADIITNDIPQNGITMTTSVATAPKQATVNVTLPGRELLALAGDGAKVKGDALIYVFDGQTAVSFARKGIDIDVSRARVSGLDAANVDITQPFDLPPGKYAMKVLVRIEGHDALAFAREDFTVGE
ncbi:MAG TPA: VWA domain-containing protein [Thermoanaerobaculia bacterium]|nr:VWA domain-containing protein [Thermoanaerobaculia bacterium]